MSRFKNHSERTSGSPRSSNLGIKDKLISWIFGLLCGLAGPLVTNYVVLNWDSRQSSTLTLDTIERNQGSASLKWEFDLRPGRQYRFSPTRTVGALLHAESTPDQAGRRGAVSWRGYDSLRFAAKASLEGCEISEVNVFVGPRMSQYLFDRRSALRVSSNWKTFELPLDEFYLAPWQDRPRGSPFLPGASDAITGMGFDIKTRDEEQRGTFWVDSIQLVRKGGQGTTFSDGEAVSFQFGPHDFIWFARAQVY